MTHCTSLSFLDQGQWRLPSGCSRGPSQATPSSIASAPRLAAPPSHLHLRAPSLSAPCAACQNMLRQLQLKDCMLEHWALSRVTGWLHAVSSTTRTRAA